MNLIAMGEMVLPGPSGRLDRVVRLWADAGFTVEGAADIHRKIWSKFVCNCTYSGVCTITGLTVGEVQDSPHAWGIALNCAREADTVARALGIQLDYDDVEAHVTKFGSTVRGAKPSMLQDHLAKPSML